MASVHRYSWTRADGSVRKAWRAKWVGIDGRAATKRGFDRKGDAQAYADDREAESRHGVLLAGERPTGKTTVQSWVTTWLADRQVRDSTAEAYQYTLKRVTDTFGARTLASLRTSELRSWRKTLDEHLAPATAEQTVSVFAMVLRDAVLDGLLETSPMPPRRGGRRAVRVVDPEQILTIEQVRAWDAALPKWAQGMAELAAITGLRQGELLGLDVERVDFLRKRIRVEQQLQRGKICAPKTDAGRRTVPLPQRAIDLLAAHIASFPSPEGEPVFLTARGKRWSRTGFQGTWVKARDEARVPVKGKEPAPLPGWAHWHALRDVAASSLIRDGNDMKTVMSIMGHSSPDETYKTYARVWPDALDLATKRLGDRWGAGG